MRYSETTTKVLLVALIALYLTPLLLILVPPTEDGPAHISIASTLGHLLLHDRPALDRYFEINWFPEPNLVAHIFLLLFLKIASPFLAEKFLFAA